MRNGEVTALQQTLKLLSDPVRLRLLALLHLEELAVQELVSITGLAQSRISNHLSLLRRAGLVRDRREGTWIFYRLERPVEGAALSPRLFAATLQPYLESEAGEADARALEEVREQRRSRSRSVHDELAESWSEVAQEFRSGALRAEAFAALVPEDLVVADLGCGAGYLTSYLVEKGARVIAVDHSKAMLAAARQRVNGRVEFRQGELEALPLEDGEVDAAFSNLVWHHVGSLERAAREVARVLRPAGSAVITDLLPHEEEWMREEMGDLRLGLQPEMVVDALAKAGFEDIARERIEDEYVVRGRGGRKVGLPLFLVRGRRRAAETTKTGQTGRTRDTGDGTERRE